MHRQFGFSDRNLFISNLKILQTFRFIFRPKTKKNIQKIFEKLFI